MKSDVTAAVERDLRERGFEVTLFGALASDDDSWPHAGRAVGEAVASGRADCGLACCWTGTGVSIAANKINGVRADCATRRPPLPQKFSTRGSPPNRRPTQNTAP